MLVAADIPAAVRALLGEPNRAASSRGRWRYGAKGSLAVDVERGLFTDFEAGEGGGILDLICRVNGGSRADAARWLETGGWGSVGGRLPVNTLHPIDTERKARPETAAHSLPYALALWRGSQSPEGSPVARYLQGRGLSLPAEPGRVLHYHPACPFGGERLPAMVALIRNAETGQPQGIHRTPLTPAVDRARGPDGAKLPKMVLGTASGGAVMLSPNWQVDTSLAVAEGIESALAGLKRKPWMPTWSAINAGGVRTFPVLAGIEVLTVYADNDVRPNGSNPGLEAARACAERWAAAGRQAEVIYPREAGADMADLIR